MGVTHGFRGNVVEVCSSVSMGAANIVFADTVPFNSEESYIFDVKQGQLLLFDAYNLPEGAEIKLERLVTGSRQSVPCDDGGAVRPRIVSRTSVLYWKPMSMFGTARWSLTPERNMLALTIPGTYRWRLSDETMLDNDAYVEYNIYVADGQIPREFWNGGTGS